MKVRLCATDAVDEGAMLQVKLAPHAPFAVYNVNGTHYVTEDTCTHGKASLADEGELEDHLVTCTWHDGKFDIRTGEPCASPCTIAIKTFPVSIEDDAVWVEVE